MADDAITPHERSAPDAAHPADPELLAGLPEPESSDMVRLNYDEWSALCADLERWLSTQFRHQG